MHELLQPPWHLRRLLRVSAMLGLAQLLDAVAPTVLWTSSFTAANRTLLLQGHFEPAVCPGYQLSCASTKSGIDTLVVDSAANSSTAT